MEVSVFIQYGGVLFAILVSYVAVRIYNNFNHWKNKNVPFVSPVSFYGNILPIVLLKKSLNQYFDHLHEKSVKIDSKFIGFWVAQKPCLYVSHPDMIKKILVQDFEYFSDRLVGYKSSSDSLGTSSFFLMKQNHWKNMRTKLNQLFTSVKIKKMEQTVSENSKRMLEFIKQHNLVTGNQPFNSRNLSTRYAADNTVQLYLGLDGQCLKDMPGKKLKAKDEHLVPKYADIGNSITSISIHRALEFACFFLIPEVNHLFRFKFFSATAGQFFKEIFTAAVNLRRQNTPTVSKDEHKFNDLLDLLMYFEDNNVEVDGIKYQGDVLPAQFGVLFTAGFETSSSLMSLYLSTMTQYPEIQDRVREEIKKVVSEHGKIDYDSIAEMKYFDMTFKEILRLYPTLPFVDRLCTKTYKTNDLTIEKDTKVFISLTGIHTDPRFWENPHKFDPERFSPENKSSIVPYSYIPFGGGPKICIGERFGYFLIKMGIATVLSEYRVRADGSLKCEIDLGPDESYESLRVPMATRGVVIAPEKPLTVYFDHMPLH